MNSLKTFCSIQHSNVGLYNGFVKAFVWNKCQHLSELENKIIICQNECQSCIVNYLFPHTMSARQQQINPKVCVNIKSTEVYVFWSSAVISCPCANLLELNFIHFKQKSSQVPTVCQQIWVVATPCSARFTDAQAQNQTAMINISKLY